jgi:hypothetical protein
MRARNRLTAIQIKNASDGKIEDGGGLRLVKKGESAKWVFRYSHLGRRREMGLGNMPTTNLAKARQNRDKWEGELAAGRDPITVRNAERQDKPIICASLNRAVFIKNLLRYLAEKFYF